MKAFSTEGFIQRRSCCECVGRRVGTAAERSRVLGPFVFWNQVVVTRFKALSRPSPGETEKSQETSVIIDSNSVETEIDGTES
jgi:hypothetical protein